MLSYIKVFQRHWFEPDSISTDSYVPYINERALRARAGLMFLIPVILLFIRLDHGDHNEIIVNAISGITAAREYSHTVCILLNLFRHVRNGYSDVC